MERWWEVAKSTNVGVNLVEIWSSWASWAAFFWHVPGLPFFGLLGAFFWPLLTADGNCAMIYSGYGCFARFGTERKLRDDLELKWKLPIFKVVRRGSMGSMGSRGGFIVICTQHWLATAWSTKFARVSTPRGLDCLQRSLCGVSASALLLHGIAAPL